MIKNNYLILMTIVSSLILSSPAFSNTVTINGYTFSDNSATLTNPFYPAKVGDQFPYEIISGGSSGQTFIFTADAVEEIYGVKCLRVNEPDIRWLAQDTEGNVHLFKILLANGRSYEVDESGDIPNIFLPASLALGDTWQWQLEDENGFEGEKYTIVSYSYTISPYFKNCIRAKQEWLSTDSSNELTHIIIKSGFGIAGREVDNVLNLVRTDLPPFDQDGDYLTSSLWAKAVLEVTDAPVTLIWKMVGSDITPSGDQVISGYFYADPDDFAYGSSYNPELFVKIYIATNGWCNIAFNHVTVDPVTVYSAHGYSGSAQQTGSATLTNRLVEHQYSNVDIDTSLQSLGENS